MDLVVIESPFAPPKGDPCPGITLQRNVAYVRAAMRMAFMEGFAPYASQALYTLPGVLIDTNPEERQLGMRGGFSWGKVSEVKMRWFMDDFGESSGMVQGRKEAEKYGQECVNRQLPGFPERWFRALMIFDVMKETIEKPVPPSLIVHLDDKTIDSLEKWAEDTEQELPPYIHKWHEDSESALPACFRF